MKAAPCFCAGTAATFARARSPKWSAFPVAISSCMASRIDGVSRIKEQRFHAVFDAFCFRWDLYGMEWDAPLPLKLTVNLTPHGTMILIPRHWSPDFARDLDWRKIGKLHRAHGARRQGPVLSVGRIERQSEAEQAQVFVQEGRRAGLKGEKLTDFVLGKLGRDPRNGTDFLKRLLKKKRKPT